ncbi:sigma 54-interacting transcriptional regulator [Kurthia sibirica]|uniref:Transcriptional regulator n=1 Tax=Kurthia sibirica TaxID=202750 RepID=A0A2U3AIN5_9BACL|nr:sigma 54-interacting transcriptional regulator [Kurthia sibirica]PWI24409.1 transcriptional regulator [Kurthia sibirica]GEK33827.1 arginine utilization regulatory protein RocR [Kurthia sibirica]
MTEQALSEMYKFITDHVAIGIHAIDKNGQTIIINSKMKELKGITDDDAQQKIMSSMNDSYLYHVLKTKKAMKNVKQTLWNQLGSEVVLRSDITPIVANEHLIGVIEFAQDITERELLAYQPLRRYGQPLTFDIITAVSPKMKTVIHRARMVALNREPVLLYGESGTGKDMVAEGIHHELIPKNEQFITLLCRHDEQAVLEQLIKVIDTKEQTTLFCDRIEYVSLDMQEKMLELFHAHYTEHIFIASVGEDPIELIAKGQLLKELYYFFASVTIHVPSLSERKEDITPFVSDYFRRYRQDTGSKLKGLSEKVDMLFAQYDWPGNLKELEVLLDTITASLSNEQMIEFDMLPVYFRWKMQNNKLEEAQKPQFLADASKDIQPLQSFMQEAEQYYLKNALEMFEGNISQTAKALGLSRQSLQYRLKKFSE